MLHLLARGILARAKFVRAAVGWRGSRSSRRRSIATAREPRDDPLGSREMIRSAARWVAPGGAVRPRAFSGGGGRGRLLVSARRRWRLGPRAGPEFLLFGPALTVRTGTTNRRPSAEATSPPPQTCASGIFAWASTN